MPRYEVSFVVEGKKAYSRSYEKVPLDAKSIEIALERLESSITRITNLKIKKITKNKTDYYVYTYLGKSTVHKSDCRFVKDHKSDSFHGRWYEKVSREMAFYLGSTRGKVTACKICNP